MHSVLLIDEILRAIFDHLDGDFDRPPVVQSFARLATVCHAWKDPVLDYLWDSLGSVDPLLALLPNVTRVDNGYQLTSETVSQDALANIAAYASRVRSVSHHSRTSVKIPPAVLALLMRDDPEQIFLPALRSVRLVLSDANKRKIPPTLYLSRNLRSVSIDISFVSRKASEVAMQPGEALCTYFDAVARVATRLEHLRLRGRVCERMTDTVALMPSLRCLYLCVGKDLSPRTLAAIAAFPHLRDLRIQLDALDAAVLGEALDALAPAAGFFPALEVLHVRAAPPVVEALFARLPPSGCLQTLRLESDFKPRSVDAWAPALALLGEHAAHSLRDLAIESLTNFCEVPDHAFPPKLHFTLDTLAPLAKLAGLRRFCLDPSVPADLSDADLAAIARWWPCIEELGLWTRPVDAFDYPAYFTMQPRATPASLAVLSAHCPQLRALTVPMDVSVLPPRAHPPMVVPAQTALESITIGCARQGKAVDPVGLAECLYRAFPALKAVEFECGEETSWGDVLEEYYGLDGRSAQMAAL
ncbi:hypothetical protein BV25DRAFT_1917282 [Artomyces pyxidatus]|uniref:Uncharacterized protein n=1 Tax=Artomyces pyxidatus TaxID=48021 RepID=A0ACB8SWP7_9AGAM|nr:hypothetical protein BV25DRAFT_1917282 [Artomyces pyxidatus]